MALSNAQILSQIPQAYRITPAETAAGVTPTNYAYSADPYVDPRRYGADPRGVSDSTTAVQTAINVAYKASGLVWIGNNCNYLCGALSLTFTGNRTNNSLRIAGSSPAGSKITANGSPAALLTLTGNGTLHEAVLSIENLTLTGTTASNGLVLQDIALWHLERVYIFGFNYNLELLSALIGDAYRCGFFSGNYGVYAREDGTISYNNAVTFRDCSIDYNTTWGIDWGAGDRLKILGGVIESGGTSGNNSTGGIAIRSTVSGGTSYATIDIDGLWMEGNYGWPVYVENTTGLVFAIRNFNLYSDGLNTQAVDILGAQHVSIQDSIMPSAGGATCNIAATYSYLKNVLIHDLNDTSTNKDYHNVITSNGEVFSPQQTAPYRYKGITASTASGTAVTLQTLPSEINYANYLVNAFLAGNIASAYSAIALVCVSGSTASVTMLNSPLHMTITLSTLDVQATQSSGVSAAISYSIMQIA